MESGLEILDLVILFFNHHVHLEYLCIERAYLLFQILASRAQPFTFVLQALHLFRADSRGADALMFVFEPLKF